MLNIIQLSLIVVLIILALHYRKIAFYDELTKVYRRQKFEKELVSRMKFINRNPDYVLHFYMVDLDNFKSINDNHGHVFGDKVLVEVSKALVSATRKFSLKNLIFPNNKRAKSHRICNTDLVGRLGGDEFAACCVMLTTNSTSIDKKIGNRLNEVSVKSGCFVSVGLSIFDSNMEIHVENLKRSADKKLYHSKKNGKGTTS